jgi:hypothetical protein
MIGSLIITIPTQEIYVLFMSTEYFVLLYSLAVLRIVPYFRWALSDQKGMSYLAKKKSLTKQAYIQRS